MGKYLAMLENARPNERNEKNEERVASPAPATPLSRFPRFSRNPTQEATGGAEGVPPLPEPLARLVRAAASDRLPPDPAALETGLVTNLERHVLIWAATYHLGGDREHALGRLWVAYKAWREGRAEA